MQKITTFLWFGREWLANDFVREQITPKGMVADVNIHLPGGGGDNPKKNTEA